MTFMLKMSVDHVAVILQHIENRNISERKTAAVDFAYLWIYLLGTELERLHSNLSLDTQDYSH